MTTTAITITASSQLISLLVGCVTLGRCLVGGAARPKLEVPWPE